MLSDVEAAYIAGLFDRMIGDSPTAELLLFYKLFTDSCSFSAKSDE